MLLPQSSAFAALKNRLNSVSNIGFLHNGPRRYATASPGKDRPPVLIPPASTAQTGPPAYDRPSGTRLKPREEMTIRWVDLLDKFKSVQERARRAQTSQRHSLGPTDTLNNPSLTAALSAASTERPRDRSGLPDAPRGGTGMANPGAAAGVGGVGASASRGVPDTSKTGGPSSLLGSAQKHKSSLPNLGRLGIGGRKSKR